MKNYREKYAYLNSLYLIIIFSFFFSFPMNYLVGSNIGIYPIILGFIFIGAIFLRLLSTYPIKVWKDIYLICFCVILYFAFIFGSNYLAPIRMGGGLQYAYVAGLPGCEGSDCSHKVTWDVGHLAPIEQPWSFISMFDYNSSQYIENKVNYVIAAGALIATSLSILQLLTLRKKVSKILTIMNDSENIVQ